MQASDETAKTGEGGASPASVPASPAPDRRAQLLDAAARVFAAKGFHLATVDEVALEAQAAKGTVYNHFESKDALFLALFDAKLQELARLYAQAAGSEAPPLDKLRRLFALHVDYLRGEAALWRVLIGERPAGHASVAAVVAADLAGTVRAGANGEPAPAEEMKARKAFFRERIRPIVETVATILAEAQEAGQVRFPDLKLAARTMVGAIMMNAFHGEDADGEQLADMLADLFLYGVAGIRDASLPAPAADPGSGKPRQSENTVKKS